MPSSSFYDTTIQALVFESGFRVCCCVRTAQSDSEAMTQMAMYTHGGNLRIMQLVSLKFGAPPSLRSQI